MSRALNWLLTGIDPMKRWTSAVSSSHATTDVDVVVDDDYEIINNEVNESGNGSSSSSTKKLQSLSTASHHLDDDIHNPASDRYGRSLIIENEEKPFVMTDSHDVLIDGVLEDVDYLSGSIEYWKSMIVASGGPVANARADAYNRQYRRPLKVTGGGVGGGSKLEQKGVHKDIKKKEELYDHNDLNAKDKETTGNTDTNTANNLRTAKITAIRPSIIPETTLEDIDQILHWRKTSAGIDDNTLAKLILGRGGCVKFPINHSIIKNDKTFEANINVL
jgi:hypothetical protein